MQESTASPVISKNANPLIRALDELADSFGRGARESFERLGSMVMLLGQCFFAPQRYELIIEQMVVIGVKSLGIVFLASTFTGFIATWQVKYLAGDVFGMRYLGTLVIRVVLTELGPTLIGLVLAGRIAAKLAAEVGTMRVTEQIDAMICLSLNPITYIISPRVIAGFIMVPVLFVFGCIAAILSAQILGTLALGVPAVTFYNSMKLLFSMKDVVIGLAKSFTFGGVIALSGCYFGYYTTGGAVGVGQAVRRAVVAASILILIFNLILSQLMV
jgi:phospholipid/cholesterol/gamma-HCH transport system permease protein